MQKETSLDMIVEQQKKGDAPYRYDEYQKYLILYTISRYLTSIHSNNQVHGNIRLTNILLDDKYSPQIQFERKEDESIKYLVSLSPEAIEREPLTKESDIYSFGVIILQVLTQKINIFSEYSEEVDTIKQLIKNNINPFNQSENIPSLLSSILSLCFSRNKTKRPSARTIQSIFEKILSEKQYEKQNNELKKESIQTKSSKQKIVKLTKRRKFPQKLKNAFRGYKPSKHRENTFETFISILDEEDGKCVDIKEDDIFTIVQQTKVSPQRAIEALYEVNGDLVTALMITLK